VAHSYIYVVRFLVEKCSVNVNDLSDSGESALHVACANNLMDIAMYLITSDATSEIYDQNGKMPVDLCGSNDLRILIEKAIVRKKLTKGMMSPLLKEKSPKPKIRPRTMDLGIASPEVSSPSMNDLRERRSSDQSKMKRIMMTPLAPVRDATIFESATASQAKKKIRNAPESFDLDDFEREDTCPNRVLDSYDDDNLSDNGENKVGRSRDTNGAFDPTINFNSYGDGSMSESDDYEDDQAHRDRDSRGDLEGSRSPFSRLSRGSISESGAEEKIGVDEVRRDGRNRTPSTVDHLDDDEEDDDTDMSETDEEGSRDVCHIIIDEILQKAMSQF
jgi:hypothetical protein